MYPLPKFDKMPHDDVVRYSAISDVVKSLVRYVNDKVPTGGFLRAVLENDLMDSFSRADSHNTLFMKEIVQYVYNYVPMAAKGSRDAVDAWLKGENDLRSRI